MLVDARELKWSCTRLTVEVMRGLAVNEDGGWALLQQQSYQRSMPCVIFFFAIPNLESGHDG